MLVAPLVAREECRPAGAGCGVQGRDTAGDSAADGAGTSDEARNLPGARPQDGFCEARGQGRVRACFGASADEKISRANAGPDDHLDGLGASFGPIYARGLVKRGQSGFAVLGVNRQELQSSTDASLTFGILWLDVCRQAQAGKLVIEGLKLFVPAECSALVRERMAHLNPAAAKWQLYELEEREEEVRPVEILDRGNISTRLVRCTDETETLSRFAEAIALVRTLRAETEMGMLSPAEIAFRCHGLEFARARLSAEPVKFRS